ncbi:cadherin-like domain-containing protein [Fuerstiella marisgermanici]|uniref:Hemolysin, chromosomal n=1 Tax=Fuerstiella marisgermanici TaxID=1891926 RepID=A0A1P8WA06_9PLAN|nr:cadherin-like domain-containing protein [Fuerstiella marisgermanici]APZ90894.1 Hemolysin, chromosomal [Fuerstiella marisgermanici]
MPRTTITSLLNRFRNTSAKRRGRANRRRQRPADLEVLESRVLLTVAPLANNDQFTTAEDATLSPAAGLLENDSDPQGYDIEVAAINGQSLSVSAGSEIATATADPNLPIFTTSLNAQNYYGFRFELTEATTIERVGGNFQFFSGTGPFAAIVALDSQADFPDAEDLSTPDVVATAVIPLAYQDDGEKSAEINADLQPGWYAVMFGTEQFGSTGITGVYLNSAPVDGTTFIHSQPEVPRFLTPTPASKIPNSRLFVTLEGGAFVPTDFALPSGAALNVSPDGQFVYDPQDAFNDLAVGQQGSEQFTYTIRSSAGLESTATSTITVHGVNDIPTAAAQSGLVSENSLMSKAAAIGLLSGAADPDGDSLFVSAINGAPLVPGQPISLPSGAEITVNADGSLLYNPTVVFDGLTDGETGSDSLTFTISDGNGGTAQETLSITINGFNDAPQIDALTDPIVIEEGQTATLSGTLIDSEGDATLTASLGDITLAADGVNWTWTYESTDSAPLQNVTITASDSVRDPDTLSFDLTVNHVPTVTATVNLSASTVEEGQQFTVSGSYTESQPTLSHEVSIAWDDFSGTQSTFSLPDSGSLNAGDEFVAAGVDATLTVTFVNPAVLNPGMTSYNLNAAASSSPSQFTVADSYVLFVADDGVVGNELWIYDHNGPRLLKDINPGVGSSAAYGLVANGDMVAFAADDGVNGTELWITDGTRLVANLNSGGTAQPRGLVAFRSDFYFTANSDASYGAFYRTDGTLAGTTQILSDDFVNGAYANAARPKVVGDQLYFRAAGRSEGGSPTGEELFVTDGTSSGTRLVRDIVPGTQSSAAEFMTDVDGTGFFQVTNASGKFELWKTDGTETGTVMVSDIVPGEGSPGAVGLKSLTALNGELYFGADDGIHGYELWKSDGTAGGTVRVTDINPNGNGFLSGDFEGTTSMAALGDELFFLGQDVNGDFELWKTDGTASGTIELEINPGSSGSWAQGFASFGNSLAFIADDGTHGRELWFTDGTSAGTQLLVDSNPGSATNQLAMLRSHGDSLVMRGSSRPSPASSDDYEFWTYNPAGNPFAEVGFSIDYAYPDDRSAEGEQDRTVTLVVDNGEPDPATASQSIIVTNVAPELDAVGSSSDSVFEAETVVVTGFIVDPSIDDTHVVDVDWGNGISSTATLGAREAAGIPFTAAHEFAESKVNPYIVTLTVTDDDGGGGATVTTEVLVSNKVPEITNVTLSETAIDEGGSVSLSVEFDDSPESHLVDVDWGDGTVDIVFVDSGFSFASLDHTYVDDFPFGTPEDTFQIVVTVNDAESTSLPATADVIVRNVAPQITSFSLTGDPENASRVILSAEYFDVGVEQEVGIELSWGDGTGEAFWLAPGETSVELSHLYVSDAGSPVDGGYEVTFGFVDDDFGFDVTTAQVAVSAKPEVTFDTYSLSFDEDAGTVQIPVLLSVPSSADITIPVIYGGTAMEGFDPEFADYTLVSTDVFIPSGQASGTLTLQILDDNIDEFEQETIELTLLETAGVTLGRTPIMTVSIFDNDVPTLSFSTQDPTFVWEDHGSVNLVAELSGPRDFDTIVQVFVSGSAANNEDYTVSSPDLETDFDGNRVLRIPAGLTAATLQVDITDNQVNETFYESLRFSISPESPDVQVGDDSVTLYVRDNDPLVTIGDADKDLDFRTVTEGDSVAVSVDLSAPTNVDTLIPLTSYGYWRRRASATDFAAPSSVTIPAGSTSATLTIPTADDNLDELSERFLIATNVGGAPQGNRVYIQINDDDTSVVNVRARTNVGEGASFPVTVSLTKPSVNDVLVKIRFSGTATSAKTVTTTQAFSFTPIQRPGDYSFPLRLRHNQDREAWITIPAGSTSATFPIGVNKDGIGEGKEKIVMSIVSVSGGAQRGTGDTVNILANRASSVAKKDVSKAPVSYTDGQLLIDTSRPNVTIDRADVERYAALFTGNGEIEDSTFVDDSLLTGSNGLLSNATMFFDANFNSRRDFLDLDGDGVFSEGDLVEPAFVSALDGSVYYTIPDAFDLNGDGTFDNSEGQLVMMGGIDTSVDQPLEQAITAPLGYGIISPMSTVVSELMQQRDLDLVAASQLTLSALGLEGFALAANNYLFNAAEGDILAGEAYRTDVRLVVTTRLITALFEGSSGADALTVGRAVYQNIAEKLNGALFDFESTAFLQSVIQGVSFRLATDIDSTVTSAAAAIISSLQHRVSEVPNDASRQYVDAMAQLHKTAEVELVPVIRGLSAATDLTQVVTDNTGTGLDALVSATEVSNVLPPEMYVSDIAVQEGVDGTTVAILQVALRGGTDVPVSVSYGTTEGSADEFDSDYVPTAGVLTWQPGDAEIKTIQVEVNGDGQFEEDEYFDVTFSDADGLVMRHDFGRIFILNDDVFGFTAESTDQPTNVRVVADGDQIEVYQDDVLAFTGGISDSGPITISAFDSVETAFELEILSPGPLLTNGIQFVGGGSELDTLVVSSTLTEGSLISLTDATSGQVEFDTGLVTFSGIEAVLDSLSATIEVQSALTEGGAVTLSAFNPVFPVEVGDSLTWTITGPNGLMIEGSGQDFTFDAGDNGDYQAELVLQRVGRGEVRATAEFSTSNIAPTAVNDVREISENVGPVIVDLLNNDSDPAGAADQLTIVAIDATAAVGIVLLESGTATYDPNGQFEGLAVGQTAVDSFSYTIDDGDGGSDTATVSITILGANDAPTVGGPLTVIATEDDATFTVDLLAGASDIDFGDVLAVDAITLVSHDDSGIIIGTNTLTVDPLAYNHLAAGDSEAIEYAFNVVDGNGGTVAQTAIITITGTNDRPAVSGPVNTGSTEDDATFTVDLLSEASDVDLSDVLNVDALTLTSGDDTGVTVGTNELTVDPAAYDHLAVGESEVIGYSYNVVDGNGGIVPQTAMVTISGVNDGPTVSAQVSAAATEDDGTFTVDLLAGGSDVDISDVLNVDSLTLAAGDDSGVTVGGNVLTIDPAAYNHLAVGESEVIGFSYNIVDGNGGSVVQTATVTISGSNDAPTIIAPVSAAATEDDGPFTVDLLEGASDEDLSDVLNVDALTLTSGDDNGVTVGANALIIDPAAYNYLAVGESEVVTFSYDIVDGNGGSVAQTATVTILGVNDVATFADITSSHPDAGNASSDGLITLAGTVRDADTSDELTVTVNWGDGSAVETLTVARPADGFSINHQYSNGGLYEITATIDDGNGSAQTVTATAAVEGVGLIGDALFFIGTDYRDKITIDETWVYDGSGWWWNPGNWDRRIVAFGQLDGDWFYETFDPSNVSSLHLDMLGGNDRVIVTTDVGVPVNADLGSGHDLAIIASSAASILAGDGNDEVWTGSGNDTVNGGAGDDLIGTDGGSDTISDPSGDNTIFSGSGNDSVTTGDGDDFILSLNGHNTIDAGHGNNVIITGSGRDTVSAGDGDDNISTDGGRDAIRAGNGNNTIDSGGGSDIVITGNGNDDVRLGAGDDVALLGSGNDTARGGSGNDAIIGGDGDDDLRGQSGRDVLIGGRGADDLRAGTGDDLLISGRTSYDDDLAAIDAIMQAWTSDNSYAARVSALQSGATSGGIALTPGSSVFSDEDNEVLRGQGGQNWYFAGQSSDSVPNNDEDEFVDWLDDMNL